MDTFDALQNETLLTLRFRGRARIKNSTAGVSIRRSQTSNFESGCAYRIASSNTLFRLR